MPKYQGGKNRNANIGGDGTDTAAVGGRADGVASVPGVQPNTVGLAPASEALAELLARDDGWLRIVPQEFGAVAYFKWKFSRGPHKNRYVMFRCDDMNYTAALWGLWQKVREVDRGERTPAYDTPYDS